MSWICPKCGREFKNTGQLHSCEVSSEGMHFAGKSKPVKDTYDKLINYLETLGEFRITPVKSSILLARDSNFMSIKPKREELDIEFFLISEIKAVEIYKQVKLSGKKTACFVKLKTPKDLSTKIKVWLRESFLLAGN